MTQKPLQAAIIGMGGFARSHHSALRALEETNGCRLLATCDPHPEQFAQSQAEWNFDERGVRVYNDYLELLDAHRDQLDFVTIPTPVPLHAPMHRACVERGLAVYLEKPPTLSPNELESMIEVERDARFATQVGFNFIAEIPRQMLKQRLLDGEFGALKRAGFLGHWPRASKYFERATWAGRLMLNERLVLDSCVGNAMAHYIHNLLFWCGPNKVLSWGEVQEVEAELYRAHDIESFDTVFARGRCAGDAKNGDVEICVAATHAGHGVQWHREWIECERATIEYHTGKKYFVRWNDGREESGQADKRNLLVENLNHFTRYLRGEETRPLTRLQDSRAFVHFNALLFIAAKHIAAVNAAHLQRTVTSGGDWVTIEGIRDVMESFARNHRLPSENHLAWSHAGGRAGIDELGQLEAIVQQMRA